KRLASLLWPCRKPHEGPGESNRSDRGKSHTLSTSYEKPPPQSPRAPGRPARRGGAAPSQPERGAAPLSLGIDRRCRHGTATPVGGAGGGVNPIAAWRGVSVGSPLQ